MLAKRTIAQLTVAAVVIAGTLALGTGTATAGPGCFGNADTTPDGKINVNGGPFEGMGNFHVTSLNIVPVDVGEEAVFLLKWKNVTPTLKAIRVVRSRFVKGEGTTTQYFVNGVHVSKQVRALGLVFVVPPGGRATVEVVMRNLETDGTFATTELRGSYVGSEPGSCDQLEAEMND